jgi:hypothetical protein
MIRNAFLIAVALSAAGCGRNKPEKPKVADPVPFTLACTGTLVNEEDVALGSLNFSVTIDLANSEALMSSIASDREAYMPPAMQNRNGDIVKASANDREIAVDLNTGTRRDTENRIVLDRRTGKFTGPSSNGSCAKAALIPLPGQKF